MKEQLSKVRANDEVVPRPEHIDISQCIVKCPFPAEHPYSSHISRFAVFPTPDRPLTAAGLPQPVVVVSKTKGSGWREERLVQSAKPSTTARWPDNSFDQVPKYPGAPRPVYYPTPPKLFAPNQDLDHVGTMNSYEGWKDDPELARTPDGYFLHSRCEAKTCIHSETWKCPPEAECRRCDPLPMKPQYDCRPCPGRKIIVEAIDRTRPRAWSTDNVHLESAEPEPPFHHRIQCLALRPTLSEREENRLLKGTSYVNLPVDTVPCCMHTAYWESLPRPRPHTFSGMTGHFDCPQLPCPGVGEPSWKEKVERAIREEHDRIQQVEAVNRWKLLNLQKPDQDIAFLRRKMALSSVKNSPEVFYDHEGRFQRERAGLYLTEYDPAKLRSVMNAERDSGCTLGDTTTLCRGALDSPLELNDAMAEAVRRGRTLAGSVPQYHDIPSVYEVMRPYDLARTMQTRHLQPYAPEADIRTQEGDVMWNQTVYGGDYNTKKYLQENFPVAIHARNEPLEVMSTVNQDLNQVRAFCRKPPPPQPPEPPEIPCCDVRKTSTGVRRTLAAGLVALNCPKPPEPSDPDCPPPPPCDRYELLKSRDQYDLTHRKKPDRLQRPWMDCTPERPVFPDGTGKGCVCSRAQILVRFNEGNRHNAPPDLRQNTRKGKRHMFAGSVHSQLLRGSTIVVS